MGGVARAHVRQGKVIGHAGVSLSGRHCGIAAYLLKPDARGRALCIARGSKVGCYRVGQASAQVNRRQERAPDVRLLVAGEGVGQCSKDGQVGPGIWRRLGSRP